MSPKTDACHVTTRSYRRQPDSADNSHAPPGKSGGSSRARFGNSGGNSRAPLAVLTWLRSLRAMWPFDHAGSSPTQLTTRMHRRAIRAAAREPVWQFGWQFVGALGNSDLTSIAACHAVIRTYSRQPNSADNSHAQPDNSGGNSRASLAIRAAIRGQFLAIRT